MNLEITILLVLLIFAAGALTFVLWKQHSAPASGWKISRRVLFEKMSDGVIVFDAQNRIADINSAALEMLDARGATWIGQTAELLLQALPATLFQAALPAQADAQVRNAKGEARFLNARLLKLNEQKLPSGRLLLLQDITERKRNEQALERMNQQLQMQIAEIQALQAILQEQATRDSLTGLYNRRFMLEMLNRELKQSARTRLPVSVIMLDIDHFKSFNDTYGHAAGDAMLRALSDWLRTKTRRGDLVCRYGGEEFLVVMPGAPAPVALQRAQEWCDGFRELHIWHEEMLLHSTLSLGTATAPTHGATSEDLIHAADMGMYAAKQAGRDCVRGPEEYASGAELNELIRQAA